MSFDRDDPSTWPAFNPLIIAHDVGRSRDRSTAVIGGKSPFLPRLVGIAHLEELPVGLYGSPPASRRRGDVGLHHWARPICLNFSTASCKPTRSGSSTTQ
jgi:hypothetical protein